MRAYELHASPKQVQRSKGRSSVAAAAYRSASYMIDERTGIIHDYTKKQGVEHSRIYTPDGAPEWAQDRGELWNAVEEIEKKSNSMTAREWEIAFPAEFNKMQRMEAGEAIARELMSRYNCAVDIAYHEPSKGGDQRNFHAHILYTTRGFDENTQSGWEKNKYRNLSHDLVRDENGKPALDDDGKKIIRSSKEALEMRQFFADEMNRIAERDKLGVETQHLSFKERGINKEPTKHLGNTANQMEQNGQKSRIAQENKEIKSANDNRQKLQDQKKIIDLEIERQKREIADEKKRLVTGYFQESKDGKAFQEKIKHDGLYLAKGKTGGFVLVDDVGEIHSLVKNIEGKSYKEIAAKLADIEKENLKNADDLSNQFKIKREQKQEIFDRDSQEIKQQKALSNAAEKAAQDQINIDKKIEVQARKILNENRRGIFKQAKIDWREIKGRHREERKALYQEIKQTNLIKEKQHRARWEAIIESEKNKQSALQEELNQTGLAGVYFRFRHGKDTRDEIENINKTIANGEMRLNESIGGKTGKDYVVLKAGQAEQREELKTRIDNDLKTALDESKQKAELINTFDNANLAGEKMSDPRTSREKWEAVAITDRLENLAARMNENKSAETVLQEEEARRQALENANTNDVSSPWLTAEQVAANVRAQAAFKPAANDNESFTNSFKPEFRERLDDFNEKAKAEPEEENQSQGRGQSPDLD